MLRVCADMSFSTSLPHYSPQSTVWHGPHLTGKACVITALVQPYKSSEFASSLGLRCCKHAWPPMACPSNAS